MKAKPPFLRLKPGFDLALGKVLLTGVVADPSSTRGVKQIHYKNVSVERAKMSIKAGLDLEEMPDEVVGIKSKILEIKRQLEYLEGYR